MKIKLFIKDIGNRKINAIKHVRSLTNMGLKDAKDHVEAEMVKTYGTMNMQGLEGKPLSIICECTEAYLGDNGFKLLKGQIESEGDSVEVIKDNRPLDIHISMLDGKSQLKFKGDNINAEMSVDSSRMVEVIKWVMENF